MHGRLQFAEFIASLPALCGFHPVDSLVLAAFRPESGGGDRFLFLSRIDLPREDASGCVAACLPPLQRVEGVEVVAVVWEASPESTATEVLDLLPAVLAAHRIPLLARLLVADGRLRFFDCSAPCCRLGSPLPRVPRVVARQTPQPLASRAAMAASLQPGPLADSVGDAVDRVGAVSPAQAVAAWAVILRSASVGMVETEDLARAVVGLGDVATRDALIAHLLPGTVPPESFPPDLWALVGAAFAEVGSNEGWSARLTEFAALVPSRCAAAPLTVCAAIFWGLGDGARAQICLDRAVEADPDYRLARLLVAMVELGVDPRAAMTVGGR